jgi:hypothetical protein
MYRPNESREGIDVYRQALRVSKHSKWLETYMIIDGQISKPKMREC